MTLKLPIAIALCAVLTTSALAQPQLPPPQTDVEQRLAALEQRMAMQDQGQPIVYPNTGEPCIVPGVPTICSSWIFSVDAIPTQLNITNQAFGPWPDDGGFALRFNLGYEWATGVGIRAGLWAFGEDEKPAGTEVEFSAATFDLDIYKRLIFDRTELLIGAGSRGAALEFRFPDTDTNSHFSGGGPSIFAEWYQPLWFGDKWEFAFIGRGRMSLVVGEWRDTTGTLVDRTNDDTMTLLEAASGLEYRRRFGRALDKCWYIRVEPELQKWDSQWMGDNLATSLGFAGTDISVGLAW